MGLIDSELFCDGMTQSFSDRLSLGSEMAIENSSHQL